MRPGSGFLGLLRAGCPLVKNEFSSYRFDYSVCQLGKLAFDEALQKSHSAAAS